MNDKGIGAIFCLISALLMSARYLSAAIYASNTSSWGDDLFRNALLYIGSPLKVASILALIAGILFLGRGVHRDIRGSDKR